ncbi:hypothetical protein K438DRAFT_1959254 [Mycena galopus ATCC 62051]|nr:hypothetical protein K438DRAFT_1959254 [Mycena galopus ATCC 62051]
MADVILMKPFSLKGHQARSSQLLLLPQPPRAIRRRMREHTRCHILFILPIRASLTHAFVPKTVSNIQQPRPMITILVQTHTAPIPTNLDSPAVRIPTASNWTLTFKFKSALSCYAADAVNLCLRATPLHRTDFPFLFLQHTFRSAGRPTTFTDCLTRLDSLYPKLISSHLPQPDLCRTGDLVVSQPEDGNIPHLIR